MITNTSDELNLDDKTVVVSYKKCKTLARERLVIS